MKSSCLISLAILSCSAQAADYTNSIGMNFVKIEAGCFMMGRDPNFENGGDDELPRHRVCIKKDFYLGETEVTQAQWVAVMGSNPSYFKGRDNPVDSVGLDNAHEFIRRLNDMEGGNKYRLPSEAEWEYAARAGSTSKWHFGDDEGNLGQYAWYDDNSSVDRTHPVGTKSPNAWGLYDMHGNVYEWVEDCYHESYSGAPTDGSVWDSSCFRYSSDDTAYVVRGGSWDGNSDHSRSANRAHNSQVDTVIDIGFRILRTY